MAVRMSSGAEILERTRSYLTQRSELYGNEFYVQLKARATASVDSVVSLSEFHAKIKDCQKCPLAKGRTHFVFGVGRADADLMCIGEAPGHDEDRVGEPFVGAAGQLLNRILASVGFAREDVYIANIIKCRPPGNRDPELDEIRECVPYLRQQIDMIQPKLILALGRVAAQTLLNTEAALGKLRGTSHDFDRRRVVVTYHPAALLRHPEWKRSAWEDVKELRRLYDSAISDQPAVELT